MKPCIVALSLRVYRVFLPLYPADLRKSFGGEMVWIFERQLRDASAAGGWRIARVWWLVWRDLASVALPGQLRNERLLACVISGPMTALILGFLIRMLQDRAFAKWIGHKLFFGCH